MNLSWLALLSASAVLAQSSPVSRQGAYWVQTETQAVGVMRGSRLRVQTKGSVIFTGKEGTRGSVTVVKRVRARTESEARTLLSAAVLQTTLARHSGRVRLSMPQRSPVAAEMQITAPANLAEVVVETQGGEVQIRNVEGRVSAESGGGPIWLDRIGGDAIGRTAGGDIRLGSVRGAVRCYSGGGRIYAARAGGEAWFETAGGSIEIGRAEGAVNASTAGGNISISNAGSWVSARTAGGRIDVGQARGIVMAGNSAGSIHIGSAVGVRCESNGGSIRLKGSAGALRAVTDVGSILAELMPGLALEDSLLSTGAGDITVYIPSNLALTIKALSESGRMGRIVSEFAEIPVRHPETHVRTGSRAEGELNGGGPVLRLTSTGGTIYLRRQR